ncbi:MAG: 4-hydroxy-tetrahydrodipicolinate reductase [Oscillibacter sp.]|nr:4-hydroxy-tetrahydrodipicolinate reductase [Oscillibacter sp.]
MKILLIGRGRMGQMIQSTAEAEGDTVAASFDEFDIQDLSKEGKVADVMMDFSRPEALPFIADYVRRTGTPLLSGTTGLSEEQTQVFQSLGGFAPVLWSANYSLCVAVLYRVLKLVAPILNGYDVEITETHHNQKTDAPSGTAKLFLEAIDPGRTMEPVYGREGDVGKRRPNEIGVHALRGGTVAGTHTVHFFGQDEELELTHRAASRQIFVNGALRMARLLPGKPNGVYDLQTLLFGA